MKMHINLPKCHKVSTMVAVIGVSVSALLIFISQIDQQLLSILPYSVQAIIMLLSMLSSIVTIPAVIISVILSLYRMAEKHSA